MVALVAMVVASLPLATAAHAQTLPLSRPTIVVLTAPAPPLTSEREKSEFAEFSSDFLFFARRFETTMRAHSQIQFQWSSADVVSFPGTSFAPIHRADWPSGWGYVLFQPGKPPRMRAGVAEDQQLVCWAAELFRVAIDGFAC